jgi:hypothetical protein
MHYNVSIVSNMMLLSFLLTNEEARKYLSLKLRSRTMEMMLYIEHFRKSLRKVEVNNVNDIDLNNLENIRPHVPINNSEMYVIDLEDT